MSTNENTQMNINKYVIYLDKNCVEDLEEIPFDNVHVNTWSVLTHRIKCLFCDARNKYSIAEIIT